MKKTSKKPFKVPAEVKKILKANPKLIWTPEELAPLGKKDANIEIRCDAATFGEVARNIFDTECVQLFAVNTDGHNLVIDLRERYYKSNSSVEVGS